MGSAQQYQVVQNGLPPVGPVDHVVGVAPGVGSGAGRESAPLVPERHRPGRKPAETTGVRRPTSRGSEEPPVAGETAPTWSSSHRPDTAQSPPPVWPLRRARTSTVTVTWGRSPPTVGRSELSRYRWASSHRASARRRAGVRRSFPPPARSSASTMVRRGRRFESVRGLSKDLHIAAFSFSEPAHGRGAEAARAAGDDRRALVRSMRTALCRSRRSEPGG